MNLRKLAKGMCCMVRVPGVCNGDPATTVLAHYRLGGISGMGIKSPDLLGAWACSACHDAVDRRSRTAWGVDYLKLCHLEGVMRTQAHLLELGWVQVNKTEAPVGQ